MRSAMRLRSTISTLTVTTALCCGYASSVRAAGAIEKSLLGVRMLATYHDVLAKFGQPSRVFRINQMLQPEMATDANGNYTGGIIGFMDSSTRTSGLGGGGFGGGGLSGGMGGMRGGMSGGIGRPSGLAGGIGGGGIGRPSGLAGGMGGGLGGGAAAAGGRRSGLGGGAAGGADATFGDAGGYVWAYLNPKKETLFVFCFNKDGRVIAISEDGPPVSKGGPVAPPTSRGLSLGSPADAVYRAYGWPDETEQQGSVLSLHYAQQHIQLTILNNKVNTIFVALNEEFKSYFMDTGGGGRGRPGAGGHPGFGGMNGPGGIGRPSGQK